MDLGEKLLAARLEAGLSQRQLCDGIITRNMLSLIEHGTAQPSMDTLKGLAARLGKTVSFFLEEEAVTSPNLEGMAQARAAFDRGEWAAALEALEGYRGPDPVYDREMALLWDLTHLSLAEEALREGRRPYARELLAQVRCQAPYLREAVDRRLLLLLGQLGERVSHLLPSIDEELCLRASEAEDPEPFLDAVRDRENPRWNLLRGKAYIQRQAYREGALCLHQAEAAFPAQTAPLLETCYRELGDYRRAYEYACRQK